MTRIIKLPSVGCALDPSNLLTHPLTSEGEIMDESLPLQDCSSSWFASLSTQDEQSVFLAIEAFEAKRLLKEVTCISEVSDIVKNKSVATEVLDFFKVAEEAEAEKTIPELFNTLHKASSALKSIKSPLSKSESDKVLNAYLDIEVIITKFKEVPNA